MIDDRIVTSLIRIGQCSSTESEVSEDCLATVADHEHVNRLPWSDWELATSSLTTADVVFLVKGLTIAESHFRWCGGSVAATIWVFRELIRRGDAGLLSELATWVFLHRGNSYLPFGTTLYWSYEDFVDRNSPEYLAERERRRQRGEVLKLVQQQARIQRRAEMARKHRENRLRGSERRVEVLQQLTELTHRDRWLRIATDWSVTLDFYPSEWTHIDDSELRLLPAETIGLLSDRLNVKCSQSWRELRKRIARLTNG
jgi:hypothetical protein